MKKSLVCGICLVLVLLASACGPAATPPPAPIAVPPTETPLPPPTEAPVPPTATPAPRTLTVFAAASLTGSFGEIGKAFEAANPGDVYLTAAAEPSAGFAGTAGATYGQGAGAGQVQIQGASGRAGTRWSFPRTPTSRRASGSPRSRGFTVAASPPTAPPTSGPRRDS